MGAKELKQMPEEFIKEYQQMMATKSLKGVSTGKAKTLRNLCDLWKIAKERLETTGQLDECFFCFQ